MCEKNVEDLEKTIGFLKLKIQFKFSSLAEKHNKEFVFYDEKTERSHLFHELKVLDSGNSFGQLALLEKKPRAATIICKEDCHFAVVEKEYFDEVLSKNFEINYNK